MNRAWLELWKVLLPSLWLLLLCLGYLVPRAAAGLQPADVVSTPPHQAAEEVRGAAQAQAVHVARGVGGEKVSGSEQSSDDRDKGHGSADVIHVSSDSSDKETGAVVDANSPLNGSVKLDETSVPTQRGAGSVGVDGEVQKYAQQTGIRGSNGTDGTSVQIASRNISVTSSLRSENGSSHESQGYNNSWVVRLEDHESNRSHIPRLADDPLADSVGSPLRLVYSFSGDRNITDPKLFNSTSSSHEEGTEVKHLHVALETETFGDADGFEDKNDSPPRSESHLIDTKTPENSHKDAPEVLHSRIEPDKQTNTENNEASRFPLLLEDDSTKHNSFLIENSTRLVSTNNTIPPEKLHKGEGPRHNHTISRNEHRLPKVLRKKKLILKDENVTTVPTRPAKKMFDSWESYFGVVSDLVPQRSSETGQPKSLMASDTPFVDRESDLLPAGNAPIVKREHSGNSGEERNGTKTQSKQNTTDLNPEETKTRQRIVTSLGILNITSEEDAGSQEPFSSRKTHRVPMKHTDNSSHSKETSSQENTKTGDDEFGPSSEQLRHFLRTTSSEETSQTSDGSEEYSSERHRRASGEDDSTETESKNYAGIIGMRRPLDSDEAPTSTETSIVPNSLRLPKDFQAHHMNEIVDKDFKDYVESDKEDMAKLQREESEEQQQGRLNDHEELGDEERLEPGEEEETTSPPDKTEVVERYRVSEHEDPTEPPTRPNYTHEGQWARPRPEQGIHLDFIPVQNYAQVRRYETVRHLSPEDAMDEAATEEELINAPRLREVVSHKKTQEVYSEEGYEDTAYDHGGYNKEGEHHEVVPGYESSAVMVKDPLYHDTDDHDEGDHDAAGSQLKGSRVHLDGSPAPQTIASPEVHRQRQGGNRTTRGSWSIQQIAKDDKDRVVVLQEGGNITSPTTLRPVYRSTRVYDPGRYAARSQGRNVPNASGSSQSVGKMVDNVTSPVWVKSPVQSGRQPTNNVTKLYSSKTKDERNIPWTSPSNEHNSQPVAKSTKLRVSQSSQESAPSSKPSKQLTMQVIDKPKPILGQNSTAGQQTRKKKKHRAKKVKQSEKKAFRIPPQWLGFKYVDRKKQKSKGKKNSPLAKRKRKMKERERKRHRLSQNKTIDVKEHESKTPVHHERHQSGKLTAKESKPAAENADTDARLPTYTAPPTMRYPNHRYSESRHGQMTLDRAHAGSFQMPPNSGMMLVPGQRYGYAHSGAGKLQPNMTITLSAMIPVAGATSQTQSHSSAIQTGPEIAGFAAPTLTPQIESRSYWNDIRQLKSPLVQVPNTWPSRSKDMYGTREQVFGQSTWVEPNVQTPSDAFYSLFQPIQRRIDMIHDGIAFDDSQLANSRTQPGLFRKREVENPAQSRNVPACTNCRSDLSKFPKTEAIQQLESRIIAMLKKGPNELRELPLNLKHVQPVVKVSQSNVVDTISKWNTLPRTNGSLHHISDNTVAPTIDKVKSSWIPTTMPTPKHEAVSRITTSLFKRSSETPIWASYVARLTEKHLTHSNDRNNSLQKQRQFGDELKDIHTAAADEVVHRRSRTINDSRNTHKNDRSEKNVEPSHSVHVSEVYVDKQKYPFYKAPNSEKLTSYTPLRYASNPWDIPIKTAGGMEFYESRDKLVHCEGPQAPKNVVPERGEDGEWNRKPQPEGPRMGILGDVIGCLRVKLFGQNPLDNPFFKETSVGLPQETALVGTLVDERGTPPPKLHDQMGFYSDILQNIRQASVGPKLGHVRNRPYLRIGIGALDSSEASSELGPVKATYAATPIAHGPEEKRNGNENQSKEKQISTGQSKPGSLANLKPSREASNKTPEKTQPMRGSSGKKKGKNAGSYRSSKLHNESEEINKRLHSGPGKPSVLQPSKQLYNLDNKKKQILRNELQASEEDSASRELKGRPEGNSVGNGMQVQDGSQSVEYYVDIYGRPVMYRTGSKIEKSKNERDGRKKISYHDIVRPASAESNRYKSGNRGPVDEDDDEEVYENDYSESEDEYPESDHQEQTEETEDDEEPSVTNEESEEAQEGPHATETAEEDEEDDVESKDDTQPTGKSVSVENGQNATENVTELPSARPDQNLTEKQTLSPLLNSSCHNSTISQAQNSSYRVHEPEADVKVENVTVAPLELPKQDQTELQRQETVYPRPHVKLNVGNASNENRNSQLEKESKFLTGKLALPPVSTAVVKTLEKSNIPLKQFLRWNDKDRELVTDYLNRLKYGPALIPKGNDSLNPIDYRNVLRSLQAKKVMRDVDISDEDIVSSETSDFVRPREKPQGIIFEKHDGKHFGDTGYVLAKSYSVKEPIIERHKKLSALRQSDLKSSNTGKKGGTRQKYDVLHPIESIDGIKGYHMGALDDLVVEIPIDTEEDDISQSSAEDEPKTKLKTEEARQVHSSQDVAQSTPRNGESERLSAENLSEEEASKESDAEKTEEYILITPSPDEDFNEELVDHDFFSDEEEMEIYGSSKKPRSKNITKTLEATQVITSPKQGNVLSSEQDKVAVNYTTSFEKNFKPPKVVKVVKNESTKTLKKEEDRINKPKVDYDDDKDDYSIDDIDDIEEGEEYDDEGEEKSKNTSQEPAQQSDDKDHKSSVLDGASSENEKKDAKEKILQTNKTILLVTKRPAQGTEDYVDDDDDDYDDEDEPEESNTDQLIGNQSNNEKHTKMTSNEDEGNGDSVVTGVSPENVDKKSGETHERSNDGSFQKATDALQGRGDKASSDANTTVREKAAKKEFDDEGDEGDYEGEEEDDAETDEVDSEEDEVDEKRGNLNTTGRPNEGLLKENTTKSSTISAESAVALKSPAELAFDAKVASLMHASPPLEPGAVASHPLEAQLYPCTASTGCVDRFTNILSHSIESTSADLPHLIHLHIPTHVVSKESLYSGFVNNSAPRMTTDEVQIPDVASENTPLSVANAHDTSITRGDNVTTAAVQSMETTLEGPTEAMEGIRFVRAPPIQVTFSKVLLKRPTTPASTSIASKVTTNPTTVVSSATVTEIDPKL